MEHEFDGREGGMLHPVACMGGLFGGGQIDWVTLAGEACAVYVSVEKLGRYVQDAGVTLGSDHLPLRSFLQGNTMNTRVDSWAVGVASRCGSIQFEYIKGIEDALADTVSRVIQIAPEIEQEPEPPGQEFGCDVFETLEPVEATTHCIGELREEMQMGHEAVPDGLLPMVDLTESQLEDVRMKGGFIRGVVSGLVAEQQPRGKPCYLEGKLLRKYMCGSR